MNERELKYGKDDAGSFGKDRKWWFSIEWMFDGVLGIWNCKYLYTAAVHSSSDCEPYPFHPSVTSPHQTPASRPLTASFGVGNGKDMLPSDNRGDHLSVDSAGVISVWSAPDPTSANPRVKKSYLSHIMHLLRSDNFWQARFRMIRPADRVYLGLHLLVNLDNGPWHYASIQVSAWRNSS